jgi:hypothetical protein
MADKALLTLEEIDAQTALELPERQLMAVAIGTGGLVGVAVAADVSHVLELHGNTICVNVAVAGNASC